MKGKDKPNYKLWVKKEGWTLKESTLLLHGRDPFKHRSLRIYDREVPPEFEKEAQTYMLLKSVDWWGRYPDHCSRVEGMHPVVVLVEALKKGRRVPKALLKVVQERHQREMEEAKALKKEREAEETVVHESQPSAIAAKESTRLSLATRERRNLLKTLGVFVHLLFGAEKNGTSRYQRAGKLNAYQIAQKVREKAEALGLEIDGLKSLDRKITEALDLLEEERH